VSEAKTPRRGELFPVGAGTVRPPKWLWYRKQVVDVLVAQLEASTLLGKLDEDRLRAPVQVAKCDRAPEVAAGTGVLAGQPA